jgi:energy-coupling factor transport system ATP-binding protein
MLQAIDLVFAYNGSTPLLQNMNLTLQQGEMVAIMGENGSGKSTMARLLKGITTPREGCIILDGVNLETFEPGGTAGRIEYLFQNPDNQICQNRVDREIAFGPRMLRWEPEKTEEAVDRVLKLTKMEPYKMSNPYDLDYYLRKRLALASVLVTDAPYLILDEPDAGQDWTFVMDLSKILRDCKNRGKGILVITHNSDWVGSTFDRVLLLSRGEIIYEGKPDDVFSNKEMCLKSGVTPPVITSLGEKLSLGKTVTGPDDFAREYSRNQISLTSG